MADQGFGAPSTRPDEDTVVIPFSYDLDRDLRDWEGTAAIAWAPGAPGKLDVRAVDRGIRSEFRLSHSEVAVTSHHPEEFFIKFVHKAHADDALTKGKIRVHGTLVQIRPWRPLSRAYATAMSFRVLLKMENVPAYAWTPHVVERIICRRCSFDRLEPRSAFMETTESLYVWVWTTNPSAIPKIIWLTFMSRSLADRASEILVTDYRPSDVKHGSTFRVLLHLATVEDYTAAPLDYNVHAERPPAYAPCITPLPYCMGVPDGVPPPAATALEQRLK